MSAACSARVTRTYTTLVLRILLALAAGARGRKSSSTAIAQLALAPGPGNDHGDRELSLHGLQRSDGRLVGLLERDDLRLHRL